MTFRLEAVFSHLTHFPQDIPDISHLAGMAGVSEATFKRLFKQQAGVGLSTFMRMVRLRRAAWHLAFRCNMSVLDIALDAGFESAEGFSRSFCRVCGVTPSGFRQEPDWEYWQSVENIVSLLAAPNDCDTPVIAVEEFSAISLALKVHRGSPATVPESVKQFIEWRRQYGTRPGLSRTFSIYYDDPATTMPERWRLGIACTHHRAIDSNPWQVTNASIPDLTVATCRVTGDDRETGRVLQYMLNEYAHRLNIHAFPPFVERHTVFPDVAVHEAQQTVYVPVTKPE